MPERIEVRGLEIARFDLDENIHKRRSSTSIMAEIA